MQRKVKSAYFTNGYKIYNKNWAVFTHSTHSSSFGLLKQYNAKQKCIHPSIQTEGLLYLHVLPNYSNISSKTRILVSKFKLGNNNYD